MEHRAGSPAIPATQCQLFSSDDLLPLVQGAKKRSSPPTPSHPCHYIAHSRQVAGASSPILISSGPAHLPHPSRTSSTNAAHVRCRATLLSAAASEGYSQPWSPGLSASRTSDPSGLLTSGTKPYLSGLKPCHLGLCWGPSSLGAPWFLWVQDLPELAPVSYTHLTLPTNSLVVVSGGGGGL